MADKYADVRQAMTDIFEQLPYGCFDFEDGRPRQIWIGAGNGITPFVARMKQLAAHARPVTVDLFHPTAVREP